MLLPASELLRLATRSTPAQAKTLALFVQASHVAPLVVHALPDPIAMLDSCGTKAAILLFIGILVCKFPPSGGCPTGCASGRSAPARANTLVFQASKVAPAVVHAALPNPIVATNDVVATEAARLILSCPRL
jgi:hypothetical protein